MLNGLLSRLAEGTNFAFVAPKAMVACVLLLNERIILDVGGQECILLGSVASLGYLSEGASEFVLAILAWNVAAVAWNLGSRVRHLTHLLKIIITNSDFLSQMSLSRISIQKYPLSHITLRYEE